MARLQRKKTPGVKKKKNRDPNANAVTAKTDQKSGRDGALSGVSEKISGSKQVLASKSISSKKTSEPGKVKAIWLKSAQFLREVKVELKKVNWPSRKQTIGSTVVVLILVLIISFFLGAVDIGLAGIIRVVLQ